MKTPKKFDELYNIDSKGRVRVWYAEIGDVDGIPAIRRVSGLKDGNLIESGWKTVSQKNVGKANETSLEDQAELEVKALYEKQLAQGGYHAQLEGSDAAKYIAPMLALKFKDVGHRIDYSGLVWSQPKLDGFRCIAGKINGLTTRKGKDIKSVPHIYMALWPIFEKYPDIILDGELYNHELRNDFNQLSSILRKQKPDRQQLEQAEMIVQYHIYDIVDATLTQLQRLHLLSEVKSILKGPESKSIVIVETSIVGDAAMTDQMYDYYLENEYEGQMIRQNDFYQIDGRTVCLIKRKEFFDEEGEITGITEGNGNWAGAAKSIEFVLEDGTQSSAGIKGNYEYAQQLLRDKHLYLGNHSQVTIRYPNKTPDGKPRFAIAHDICIGPRNS